MPSNKSFFSKKYFVYSPDKLLLFFVGVILVLEIVFITFFERGYFLQKYDNAYWKDRYEHSQWQLPLSKRIIGDDGLYRYASYLLIHGSDPTIINAETPPVGKYLIGLSILLFYSSAYYGLIMGVLCLVIFYYISEYFLNNKIYAFLVIVFLALDPIFFSQLWNSWLDIAQLFFLLLSFYFFILSLKYSNLCLLYSLLCGVCLGFFSEVKFAVLSPIIIILFLCYLFKKKNYRSGTLLCVGVVVAILFSYSMYFLHGHRVVDFIKLQKYILSFYGLSKLSTHYGSLFYTLLLGKFQAINSTNFLPVREWTILWVVIFVNYLITVFFLFKTKSENLYRGVILFCLFVLIVLSFIPSYPRYLLIILPFFYLIFVKQLLTYKHIYMKYLLILTMLGIGFYTFVLYLIPAPDTVLENFSYNLSHGFFYDIYQENITAQSILTKNEFRSTYQNAWNTLELVSITIHEKKRKIDGNKASVSVHMDYQTRRLGVFSEDKVIHLIKQNQLWKVVWTPDVFLNKYKSIYSLEMDISEGKRGTLYDSQNNPLVEDTDSYLISVNPDKMDKSREAEMLSFFETMIHIPSVYLQNAYLENTLPDTYVPLFSLFTELSKETEKKLLSYPGVKYTPYISRIYYNKYIPYVKNTAFFECCTKIYSSYAYHGSSSSEDKYDKILTGYNGGEITINDQSGQIVRVVYKKESQEGKDVTINSND